MMSSSDKVAVVSELSTSQGQVPSTYAVKKKITAHGPSVKLICARNTAVARMVTTCRVQNCTEMGKAKIRVNLQ